jgi:CRISPR-associated endonuclease Cas2
MLQFSVYVRFLPKGVSAKGLVQSIESYLPDDGRVTVFLMSDSEYSSAFRFVGNDYLENYGSDPDEPDILTLF